MTTREDLYKFIRLLDDKRLYEMGGVLHVAFEETYGGETGMLRDNQDMIDADELLSLLWAASTEDGKNEPPG
jgi:hypothetical protein